LENHQKLIEDGRILLLGLVGNLQALIAMSKVNIVYVTEGTGFPTKFSEIISVEGSNVLLSHHRFIHIDEISKNAELIANSDKDFRSKLIKILSNEEFRIKNLDAVKKVKETLISQKIYENKLSEIFPIISNDYKVNEKKNSLKFFPRGQLNFVPNTFPLTLSSEDFNLSDEKKEGPFLISFSFENKSISNLWLNFNNFDIEFSLSIPFGSSGLSIPFPSQFLFRLQPVLENMNTLAISSLVKDININNQEKKTLPESVRLLSINKNSNFAWVDSNTVFAFADNNIGKTLRMSILDQDGDSDSKFIKIKDSVMKFNLSKCFCVFSGL